VEREMSELQAEHKAVDEWLASPAAYAETERAALKERVAKQGDLAWRLARLEAEWLEIAEALERSGTEP
jgi:ATP-binding cassette subfamily F protein 3